MSFTAKILAVVSSLILLISGITFLTMSLGDSTKTLDLTRIKVQEQSNINEINRIADDVKDLIEDYHNNVYAKITQLDEIKESIENSVGDLEDDVAKIMADKEIIDSNVMFLEKQTELIKTSCESAIEMYLDRKAREEEANKIKQPEDKPEDQPEDKVEQPEDKPDDKVEQPNKNEVKDGDDSVVLRKPLHLPNTYLWPLASGQQSLMMQGIVYVKSVLFNYFKPKLNDAGEFDSFNKEVPAYFHIGQNSLAYSIFKQEVNTDVKDKILNNINSIVSTSNSQKVSSSELAFTVIGLVFANMKATSQITNTSKWEPIDYNEFEAFNEKEKKIVEWAIKTLLKRQTKSGGWSNTHIESEIIYDYDVVTTSLALYALTLAYQTGITEGITEEILINGVNYLQKMQSKQDLKKKSPVLDANGMPFENCNLRGWGFNGSADPTVRTTALVVTSITRVMHVLRKISQENDAKIAKFKVSVVDGLAFMAEYWKMTEDFYTNWAVVQACAATGITKIGSIDVFSELMTYFSDRTKVNWISKFSFSNTTFAYWCVKWCKQESGFFKPMKIAGYEK